MMLSELIEELQNVLLIHGDVQIVSGIDRSGYGEPVESIVVRDDVKTAEGDAVVVVDLVIGEDSIVAVGGF